MLTALTSEIATIGLAPEASMVNEALTRNSIAEALSKGNVLINIEFRSVTEIVNVSSLLEAIAIGFLKLVFLPDRLPENK